MDSDEHLGSIEWCFTALHFCVWSVFIFFKFLFSKSVDVNLSEKMQQQFREEWIKKKKKRTTTWLRSIGFMLDNVDGVVYLTVQTPYSRFSILPDLIFCHVIFVYEICLVHSLSHFDWFCCCCCAAGAVSPFQVVVNRIGIRWFGFYCHFSYQCNNGLAKLMLLSIYFYYNSTASLTLVRIHWCTIMK